ncbi:uracil phosphoribosyltransferase [Tunicatimonas pelagia]|uniref:uracil phosphoribosyltransferase n=1 Tax=Tunicatimonas pelagia TaxID=931531 RepID=UPI0026666951|nr:uracil phosphoribosyltransferase [Tunicatimonas pelagia]WKN44429.1 uracil phosphoribosyltransferase [Tunicatimonas pelagia]
MQQASLFVLAEQPSVANHFMAELRDRTRQTDRMRFRRNIERLGEILAYELSKTLPYRPESVTTPLGTADISLLTQQPVLVSILRAGLPLHWGVLNYFDQADSGFIGAYRQNTTDGFTIQLDYQSMPSVQDRPLILIDPMLASGQTLVKVLKQISNFGIPSQIHILSVIAAPEGISLLEQEIQHLYRLWVGAIDNQLNDKSYIIPGLGDAGDLAFGNKL